MPVEQEQQMLDEITTRIFQLAENNYNCSQIMMILALQDRAKENPGLVRAMHGLGGGCGFYNETCGLLTGAVCVLSWHAGRGADNEQASEKLMPMLREIGDWFQQEIGKTHGGTRCKDIIGALAGTSGDREICGVILLQTVIKVNAILEKNNFR